MWTLWILMTSNAHLTQISHAYAHDEAEAWTLAAEWFERYPDLPQREVRACPYGYRAGFTCLPGTIDEQEAAERCTSHEAYR